MGRDTYVGHERLETHVFDTCDVLGAREVLAGLVEAALAGVVAVVLGVPRMSASWCVANLGQRKGGSRRLTLDTL